VGEFVGWLESSLREIPESLKPEKMGYLEGWFVVPKYRRKGIGKKLVEAAEAWAREQGCSVMGSDTWPENEVSLIAHEKLGYGVYERAVNFRKKLREGEM
jgi:aminoglycoside 6'-N-acetyltransferase I